VVGCSSGCKDEDYEDGRKQRVIRLRIEIERIIVSGVGGAFWKAGREDRYSRQVIF
jgi:hypothetical protein